MAPWNLVINEDQWAFIDWDLAAPGSRLWDLAYAIHGFVPLTASTTRATNAMTPAIGYVSWPTATDSPNHSAGQIIPMLASRTRAMHTFLADQAAQGAQPWARLWHEGHGEAWRADTKTLPSAIVNGTTHFSNERTGWSR